jgi:enoyl-CoA hydratase/carnithine racemase
MTEAPFSVRRKAGILYLTLDTPRAKVNIFDRPSAEQLISILERLPRDLRAVVFESGKPGSFINGVGLMMASSVRSVRSAERIAAPILRAYQLIEESPVPTIAAIRGSCFGCGVELALRCKHRLAADTIDTVLYMTELADYLFTPAFGGVSRLPALLGLERAAEFLLWGERWSAREAVRSGLVDRLLVEGAVEAILERGPIRRSVRRGSIAKHKKRIAALPPSIAPAYRDCLELMARGGKGELALSAKTASRPASKAALGFFFVRQIAGDLCRRGAGDLTTDATTVPAIARAFGLRVQRAVTGRAPHEAVLYHPDRRRRRALIEVTGARGAVAPLERAGFVAIVSSPVRRFAIDSLLLAHFEPLLRALERGVSVPTINQTLRRFGFVERPHALLERFPLERLIPGAEALRDPRLGERTDRRLIADLRASWLACARDLLNGTLAHPTILDLAAREVLDFPLQHTSLCSYLDGASGTREFYAGVRA